MNESLSCSHTHTHPSALPSCFLENLVFFNYHRFDFSSRSLNWYWDKRKHWKKILHCMESNILLLLSILWAEERLRLCFSLFWIFSSSFNTSDITHNRSVDRRNMHTIRYELECFDVWWYAKNAQMSAGNSTCMERSKQDDINGLLSKKCPTYQVVPVLYVHGTIEAGWYQRTFIQKVSHVPSCPSLNPPHKVMAGRDFYLSGAHSDADNGVPLRSVASSSSAEGLTLLHE
jgi:hypothetical protein